MKACAVLMACLCGAQPLPSSGLPSVSASAFRCMVANLYHEARGEGVAGMQAVAQVVMNRAANKATSICAVVYAHKQFSWANTAKGRSKPLEGVSEVLLVVAYQALAGAYKDATGGATHYHAACVKPRWAKHMEKTVTIGKHIFYKGV